MKRFLSLLLAGTLAALCAGCSQPDSLTLDLSQGYGKHTKLIHLNASTAEKEQRLQGFYQVLEEADPLEKDFSLFAYYPDYLFPNLCCGLPQAGASKLNTQKLPNGFSAGELFYLHTVLFVHDQFQLPPTGTPIPLGVVHRFGAALAGDHSSAALALEQIFNLLLPQGVLGTFHGSGASNLHPQCFPHLLGVGLPPLAVIETAVTGVKQLVK